MYCYGGSGEIRVSGKPWTQQSTAHWKKNQGGTDGASLARSRLAELLALSASCEALPVLLLLRWGEAAEKWASDFLHLHQKNMYIRWRVNAEGRFVFSAVKTSQGGCCSFGLAAKIPRSWGCFLELLSPPHILRRQGLCCVSPADRGAPAVALKWVKPLYLCIIYSNQVRGGGSYSKLFCCYFRLCK